MIKAAVTQVWHNNDRESHEALGPFEYGLNHSYTALLDRPGLIPFAVLPVTSVSPEEILRNFDMLVLTGGGDPSPWLFGREDQGSRNPKPYRSAWDMKLFRAARNLDMPVLGICLGIQIIGITEGAALIQHIDSPVFHDGSFTRPAQHPVDIAPGTQLYSLFGSNISVSTFHHQALESVPDGYKISARSRDGLIEGIESSDGRVIGVQWHPERDFTGVPLLESVMSMAGKK